MVAASETSGSTDGHKSVTTTRTSTGNHLEFKIKERPIVCSRHTRAHRGSSWSSAGSSKSSAQVKVCWSGATGARPLSAILYTISTTMMLGGLMGVCMCVYANKHVQCSTGCRTRTIGTR